MEKLNTLNTVVNNTRTSINNKNVPITNSDGFIAQPDAVRAINFQDYSEELKPTIHGVNYYDYNGDLLYVYNVTDFLALTEHPAQPLHQGLVADGWNWDLTDAQDFVQNTCDCLNIGGLYVTESGKTEIYFTWDAKEGEKYTIGLYYRAKRTDTTYSLLIDWGDGTTTDVTTGINTGFVDQTKWHTYPKVNGTYCIKITGTNVIYTVGNNASYTSVFGYAYTSQRCKIAILEKIYFGNNTQVTSSNLAYWGYKISEVSCINADYSNRNTGLNGNAFNWTWNLKGFVIPNGVTSLGNSVFVGSTAKCICLSKTAGTSCGSNAFNSCVNLNSIIIAADCTSLGANVFESCRLLKRVFINGTLISIPNYAFRYCCQLEEVTLPDTITTLGTAAFYECLSLKHLEFPSTITSVGLNCFNSSASLKTVIFHSETPPTAGTTPFGNCPSLEGIYVPYSEDHSILTAYKEATNWSTYAAKIFELDENGNILTE